MKLLYVPGRRRTLHICLENTEREVKGPDHAWDIFFFSFQNSGHHYLKVLLSLLHTSRSMCKNLSEAGIPFLTMFKVLFVSSIIH